jgi:hypothetical protein
MVQGITMIGALAILLANLLTTSPTPGSIPRTRYD